VLIDYGLARHLDLPDLMSEQFRLPYGTAPYMAPEQVLGERSDVRSDQFALGSLLYFFATGERPFGDPQRLSGLKKRIWWDPPPPSALRKDMPNWFQEIVLRCLEVNARQRYPTAAQLAFDLRHPVQVKLTKRAYKDKQTPWIERLGRSMQTLDGFVDHPDRTTAGLADAPIVMVAIDVSTTDANLQEALRNTVSRILEHGKSARLACVNVLKLSRIALDSTIDEEGKNRHLARIVELKDWARELGLDESRISYHVLESTDPADAILEYARHNGVDHIVMGARANTTLRRLLGSVSGKVAAEAPCSVTVVRERTIEDAASDGQATPIHSTFPALQ
jgi:eukaryotic-like serine/threonine-protein kinase